MYDHEDTDIFEKRELRSNRSHSTKRPGVIGFVKKSIKSNSPIDERKISLPNDGCDKKWNKNVAFSLKKKGRWALVDEFRSNLESWNNFKEDVGNSTPIVTAVEKRLISDRNLAQGYAIRGRPMCLAFHTMEETEHSDEPVATHRYPKKTYAEELTFLEKPKPQKKKPKKIHRSTNDRRPLAAIEEDQEEQNNESPIQLQYEFYTSPTNGLSLVTEASHNSKRWYVRRNAGPAASTKRRCKLIGSYLDDITDMEINDFDQDDQRDQENQNGQFVELPADQSYLTSVDDHDLVPEPAGSMSVNLVDLAYQNCLKKDNRAQQRLNRKLNRRSSSEPTSFDDFHVDDVAGPSNISNSSSDWEIVDDSSDADSNLSSIAHLHSDDYFQFIPILIRCLTDSLSETELKRVFGDAYYECSCVPRRFVINVTDDVTKSLASIYGDKSYADFDIKMLCVCEIPRFGECSYGGGPPTTYLRVWINGSFTKEVRNVCIDTINPCAAHSMENVVEGVVKSINMLPLEYYEKKQRLQARSFQPNASQLLVKASTKCLDPKTAAVEFLEEQKMTKKLQRQITAVLQYDMRSTPYEENVCGVCLEYPVDLNGFCLPQCGHWFCSKCWRICCVERILNGWGSQIPCPHPKCDSLVDYDTMTSFLPLPVCQTYAAQLTDQCVRNETSQFVWCPNVKCGRVVQLPAESDASAAVCVCGSFWCTQCEKPSHWPANCEHAKIYFDKVLPSYNRWQDDLKGRRYVVDVKRCPHCQILMEKGEGCICMTCRCGKLFCWACGKAWDDGAVHQQCYNVHEVQGFLHVRLVDIRKSFNDELQAILYERSVSHHTATRATQVGRFKRQMLTKCWKIPKRLQNSITFYENDEMDIDQMSESCKRQLTSVAKHVKAFLELYHQGHYLLEFVYLHMQYCDKGTWSKIGNVKWAVDRLEFLLQRIEEECEAGNLKKVNQLMEHIKKALKSLIYEAGKMKTEKSVKNV